MKNIRHEAMLWLQVTLIAVLWFVLLATSSGKIEFGWEAIKELPHVVAAYAVVAFIFVRWAWRWRLFAGWLVPYPDLQGTWVGTVQTIGATPTPGPASAIPATLVLRQSFHEITCVMYTDESESHSTAASLSKSEEGGIIRMTYTFLNRPKLSVRDRSSMHDGAALLSLERGEGINLAGEYWTSRRTIGELKFQFYSRRLAEAHQGNASTTPANSR